MGVRFRLSNRMKTQNKITKNAKKKAPHPNSRAALKLAGAQCRQERLAKKTDVKAFKMAEKVSRFLWFQDEIRRLDNQKEVSIEEIKSILIKFISRTEKDLKKIQKIKRIGKRKNNDGKELEIKGQSEKEFNLLESTGLEAPNFTNSKHLENWLEWDGEFDSMLKLKTKLWTNKRLQITKDDIEKYISTNIEETNDESDSEES